MPGASVALLGYALEHPSDNVKVVTPVNDQYHHNGINHTLKTSADIKYKRIIRQ